MATKKDKKKAVKKDGYKPPKYKESETADEYREGKQI